MKRHGGSQARRCGPLGVRVAWGATLLLLVGVPASVSAQLEPRRPARSIFRSVEETPTRPGPAAPAAGQPTGSAPPVVAASGDPHAAPIPVVGPVETVAGIQIPPEYGRILATYVPPGAADPPERVIIHIQDAHVHYEAQKNLAMILDGLMRTHGLRLVLGEGGSGDESLSYLRMWASKEVREEVADRYLREGKISGEEYLDIVSDHPMSIYGIEDEALYLENGAVYEAIDAFDDEALAVATAYRGAVDTLKFHLYSDALRAFDAKRQAYQREQVDAVTFYRAMYELADTHGVPREDVGGVDLFLRLSELEGRLDYSAVEQQRGAYVEALTKVLDEGDLQEMLARSLDFRMAKLAASTYYTYLRTLGEAEGVALSTYPQLADYIAYLEDYARLDEEQVLSDEARLAERLEDRLAQGQEERTLLDLDRNLTLLLEFIQLKLAPKEYARVRGDLTRLRLQPWRSFLARHIARFGLKHEVPQETGAVDANLSTLSKFYEVAEQRDLVFVANTLAKMEADQVALAVVITGGFHTPGLTKLFEERGLAYLVVAPRITQPGDPELYRKILRYKAELRKQIHAQDPVALKTEEGAP